MIYSGASFWFLSVIFVTCQSAFVDHLKKCGINDGLCQKKLLQNVLREIGKTGIPELGIPPIDPYSIKDVSASILNIIEIGMIDGVAKGIKDCVVNRFDTHIEARHSVMEMTCDLTIKGKYWVKGSSPLIKDFLGGSEVHGEGIGKVVLKKLRMKFEYNFDVKEIGGDTFIACNQTAPIYSYDVEKAGFEANNIYLGDQEASGLIIPMLNENSKFIMQTFGKSFVDTAMDIVFVQSHKFFDLVPTKYYITDDLSPYVNRT